MRLRALLVLALVSLASPASAGIRYVNAALTTGANDGSTWANAFRGAIGVQSALGVAQLGDQIWVACGSYQPAQVGSPSISFVLRNGVELYGGFVGNETSVAQRDPLTNVCILSGDLAGDDGLGLGHDSENSTVVVLGVLLDTATLIDGFTIRGGNNTISSYLGAGLHLDHCSAVLKRCRIEENKSLNGGGAYVFNGAPTFEGCEFRRNSAQNWGGGALLNECGARMLRCTFLDDAAVWGGGLTVMNAPAANPPLLDACVFRGNHAVVSGGAVYAFSSPVHLASCRVLENRAGGGGGGLFFDYGSSHVLLDCLVCANTAGIWPGGAIYGKHGSDAEVRNCTLARNESLTLDEAGIALENGNLTMFNSIVYANHGPSGTQPSTNQIDVGGTALVQYCSVDGGWPGAGNISLDPMFANPAAGDFDLSDGSPCADAGNNAQLFFTITTDILGRPRIVDSPASPDTGAGLPGAPLVDMGAFEAPNRLYTAFCAGDGSLATACPCGNTGATGHGCASSDFFSTGALLEAEGIAAADTVVLVGSDIYPPGTCVFLQGNQQNLNGVVFGDGVRCVAGSLKRLFIKSASGGMASAPGAGDPSISARSAALGDTIAPGSQRFYQVYYRDPDLTFCAAPTGNSWNVSSGVIVNW